MQAETPFRRVHTARLGAPEEGVRLAGLPMPPPFARLCEAGPFGLRLRREPFRRWVSDVRWALRGTPFRRVPGPVAILYAVEEGGRAGPLGLMERALDCLLLELGGIDGLDARVIRRVTLAWDRNPGIDALVTPDGDAGRG